MNEGEATKKKKYRKNTERTMLYRHAPILFYVSVFFPFICLAPATNHNEYHYEMNEVDNANIRAANCKFWMEQHRTSIVGKKSLGR